MHLVTVGASAPHMHPENLALVFIFNKKKQAVFPLKTAMNPNRVHVGGQMHPVTGFMDHSRGAKNGAR